MGVKNLLPPMGLPLFCPLLLASVILHGLVLTCPWPKQAVQDDSLLQVYPPGTQAPLATIRLEQLLVPPADGRVAAPPPLEVRLARSEPAAVPRPDLPSPDLPRPDLPRPDPSEALTPPKPDASPPQNQALEPIFTPEPPVDFPSSEADSLQTVLNHLQGTIESASKGAEATPDLFDQPADFFTGLDEPGTNTWAVKANILRTAVIEGKTPDQVFITLLSEAGESGFRSIQQADYGGGLLYEVVRQDQRWFFNLVPSRHGQGTVIVVWVQAPG
jgi:hypothetical protein